MAVARNSSVVSGPILSKSCKSSWGPTSCWTWTHRRACVGRTKLKVMAAADSTNNSVASSGKPGVQINGGMTSSWWQEAFAKVDTESGSLLQLLHEGARVFCISMERNESLIKGSWLLNKWTGFDTKAWMKLISYQVSVYAALQAAMEIAMRGEGRDRNVHVFVQRSLQHQCDPLESSIRKLLASRDSSAADWLWSTQLPFLVTSFVNILEKDPQFLDVTSTRGCDPSTASDVALLRLTITICGAAMKLGPATISCPPFSSTLTEEIGRLMNMLTEFIPISEVYSFSVTLGLRREFLLNFGPRAASNVHNGELDAAERAFWVDLCEQLLRNTLSREGVLAKLHPHDTPEALERDLAVFGFFAALGRRARAYLTGNGDSQLDDTLASLLRYLEGGCVLFYPQLSTLTYYQLFIEVACEEMEWLPTFPKSSLIEDKRERTSADTDVSIYKALNVCSRWVADFLKYSSWVQDPAGSRVVDFLIKCQSRLLECREEFNLKRDSSRECVVQDERSSLPATSHVTEQQFMLFDENMEEAICKLESLLESSSAGTTDRLVAVRKDLERLRRLKKEAEALEASMKAKSEGNELQTCSDINDDEARLDDTRKTYNEVFYKSIEKLREASADLWRGTQLLGTDVAAATILLKNGALGQALTEREKKTLMRTFTDLASVIPIGFLMLLPVTAVGHAAMLAAIQKYVPALIPSAYGPERLDLLRQLEKVKEMETENSKDDTE